MHMFTKALILGIAGTIILAGSAPAADYTLHKDLAYADRSERNVLDIYLPEGVADPPLVMWIHGGGWSLGDKAWPWGLRSFLKAGIGVAAMNYRYCPDAVWPAQLDDLDDAFAFLRAHGADYGYDGTRLAAFGHSSGGHLAAVAGLAFAADPATRLKASIVVDGPIDFVGEREDAKAFGEALGKSTSASAGSTHNEACLIGASVMDNPELAWRASPLSYLADLPPGTDPPAFMILNGARDFLVPPFQTRRLFDALLARAPNSEIVFELIPKAGHMSIKLQTPDVMDRVAAFLKRNFDR